VKKLSEKFSINSTFINFFLKKVRILSTEKKSNFFLLRNNNILNLLCKFKILKNLKTSFTFLNFFNWVIVEVILNNIIKSNIKKINLKYKRSSKPKNQKLRFKLQKINGFIYFKILGIFIENIIYFFTKIKINININSI
jgi:hypothetical protein